MQPIEKNVAYFEKNQQEFQDLAIKYIWNSISEKDESLLSQLILQSSSLEKQFIEISQSNSLLENQQEEYSDRKGLLNSFYFKISSAAILLFSIIVGFFYYYRISSNIENPNNVSIKTELIRSLGNCKIIEINKNQKEIVSKKHSICDVDLKKLRFQRLRIYPNSKVKISYVNNLWEIEIVQGLAYITTMKNNSSEDFFVYLGSNRWIQFLGTSVVVNRDKITSVKILEGEIRYLESKNLKDEQQTNIIEKGNILTFKKKNGYSMSLLNRKEILEIDQTFINLKKDKLTEPKIDIQQIISKKLQEIPGDHIILKDGREIDVDTIWQDEEFYILNIKGEIETFPRLEIKKIQFKN